MNQPRVVNRYYQRDRDIELVGHEDTFTRDEVDTLLQQIDSTNNNYATTQSHSQNALNSSLLQAQIGLLIAIYVQPASQITSIQIALSVFVCMSIGLELLLFAMLTVKASSSTEKIGKSNCSATGLNNWAAVISYVLVMFSFVILGLRSYAAINPVDVSGGGGGNSTI